MLHLSWVLTYHSYFNLSSWGKAYLIDDQSRCNNKQSGYIQIHDKAEKIVERIVEKFCLIFSSIKAEVCNLAEAQLNSLCKIVQKHLCFAFSLLSYKFVNYTVLKLRPLITKIFETECLLNSQLPKTHGCLSAAQEFCPNPLLWVVILEKTCNKLIFSCFAGIWPNFCPTNSYRRKKTKFYDEIAF